MLNMEKFVLLATLFGFSLGFFGGDKSSSDVDSVEEYDPGQAVNSSLEACWPQPRGGVEWLISVRDPDLAWGADTARAVVTLAVNRWTSLTPEEADLVKLQLSQEITKAMIWNHTKPIHSTDLALYVQALVAIGKNPRNFYGYDLVADLLHRTSTSDPHPVLVLALCDANALELQHLLAIRSYLEPVSGPTRRATDLKAMALKAFACAATLEFGKFKTYLINAAKFLISKQKDDGSFGNLHTSALIVQALIAANVTDNWLKEEALSYIYNHSLLEQNVMGVYYSELALKADVYPFVKDIYPERSRRYRAEPEASRGSRLHYTVRNNRRPDVHLTIAIRVPGDAHFFDVMQLSAAEDPHFGFSYYLDAEGLPTVYAVDGVPNDPEENYYWRLCRQQRVHDEPHKSVMHTVHHSPILEKANESHHFIMWYRDTRCEKDSF